LQEPKESDIPSGPRLSDPPESTANGKLCTARYADARWNHLPYWLRGLLFFSNFVDLWNVAGHVSIAKCCGFCAVPSPRESFGGL